MENKKNMWIGGAVVALVVIGLIFWSRNKASAPTVSDETSSTSVDSTGTPGAGSTDSGAASISYADALIKYADRRLQFNNNCQATPRSVTYKDNTGIMLDNRSAQTRTIKVGETYTVPGYGFKIVVLPDTYLKSKTILVDCGTSQNVATILVQE